MAPKPKAATTTTISGTMTATDPSGKNYSGTFQLTESAAPVGDVPVVTDADFQLTLPATAGQTVGIVSATNSPTSWSIVDGDPSGFFTIINSGLIAVSSAGASGLGESTFNLTVQATNAAGKGSGAVAVAVKAAIQPPVPNTWHNIPIAQQAGGFKFECDAKPSIANLDNPLGLSNGAASAYTNLACIVRFTATGTIDARNGGTYDQSAVVNYSANVSYHIRIMGDIASHTYDVYVTPDGGSETQIAKAFAFRSEQSGVTQLNNLGVAPAMVAGGLVVVSNVTMVANSVPPPISGWVDGLDKAPGGTPQNPHLLDNFPAGHGKRDKTIVNQPPFNVPGVDYRVGIQTGVVLKPIAGNVPAGCSWSGNTLTVTGTDVTVEGIDFPTGAYISVQSSSGNVTIKNCRLHGTVTDMSLIHCSAALKSTNVYVGYCELMHNGGGGANNPGTISSDSSGVTNTGSYTFEYCWLDGAGYDVFRLQGGSFHLEIRYCYISGMKGGGHPDVVQQLVSNVSFKAWNNCIYTTVGTQGIGTDPGNCPPCNVSQNVHVTPSGNAFSIAGAGFNAPPYFEFNNNYCECGGYHFTYNAPPAWSHHAGNYWLKTGQGYYN
jgi:hypothetical protein